MCSSRALAYVSLSTKNRTTYSPAVCLQPFAHYDANPSWAAVKPLHGRRISLGKGAEVVLHALQLPVKYSAVLDTLSRVHATRVKDKSYSAPHPALKDAAGPFFDPDWVERGFGGAGASYPEGFRAQPPPSGWDAILHCGVAGPGFVRLETVADRASYDKPDITKLFAPSLEDERPNKHGTSHHEDGTTILQSDDPIRGFPYTAYSQAEYNDRLYPNQAGLFPDKLLAHLHQKFHNGKKVALDPNGQVPIRNSTNAGLYLCEFTLYGSLAESLRAARAASSEPVPVLFVHCPSYHSKTTNGKVTDASGEPIEVGNQPSGEATPASESLPPIPSTDKPPAEHSPSTEEVTLILQEVAMYMARFRGTK